VSTPVLVRAVRGSWSTALFRIRKPSGRPPAAVTSPFTPAVVVVGARRCSIAVSFSEPWISSFERTGWREYRPPGLGATRTFTPTGPCSVKRTCFSYVTPGMSSTGCAYAGAAKAPATSSMRTTLRDTTRKPGYRRLR
jgi:hypothetical protein